MAVGLHDASRSIYLIGGHNTQGQFTEYSIDLNTFGPTETIAFGVYVSSYGQFWTQQQDIVYMMKNAPRSLTAFDLETNSYSESFPSLQLDPGSYSCVASAPDYIYVTGGSSQKKSLQVFQISISQWTLSNRQMNTGRSHHSCVVHDSYLYVMGGFNGAYLTGTERVYADNLIAYRLWENSVALVQGVIYARAVSCGGKLFVIGGWSGTETLDIAQLIDPVSQTTTIQYMSYAVHSMGVVCFEPNIYVFGGETTDNVFYYTEFTDGPTKNPTVRPTWITRMPSVRPSQFPTRAPSDKPTRYPSNVPSESPTITTQTPSNDPSRSPSNVPSNLPSFATESPSNDPTRSPSGMPSSSPTRMPTRFPSEVPSQIPTRIPSKSPSNIPSSSPTEVPSRFPSVGPSQTPTQMPSNAPSNVPTLSTIAPSNAPSRVPIETTASDDDASVNAGMFDGFTSTQVTLIVILIILTAILFVVLISQSFIKHLLSLENRIKQCFVSSSFILLIFICLL
eukprot:864156_1